MRFLGDRLSKAMGQPVVIDNRPGASTIIGAQTVATAPADGYTLLYTVGSTLSLNPYIYKTLPYKAEDFIGVVKVVVPSLVLVTSANSPYKTADDLIQAAKASPGKLNYASYGVGQTTHVLMVRYLDAMGASMTHVPYKDGGITDIIAGTVTASFEPVTTAIPQINGGRLKGLAITAPKRVPQLPAVPAVAESIPGFFAESYHGIMTPKGTPTSVVNRIAALSKAIIDSEEFRQKVGELALLPAASDSPAEFQKYMVDDAKIWARVVKENNITAE
jgi:tripartite-type tricarboxylate transporter receptor subunit TctC